VNGYPVIGECLESLYGQSCADRIEVVVANRCKDGVNDKIAREYPDVKLLDAPERTTIPVLRAMAMRETAGNVIAVIEDHCIVDKEWAGQILEAHRGKYPVIAGSVENAACDRITDWAAFFCEYGNAMKPVPEGEADQVVGNNVAYKKWLIERFWPVIEKGVWDSILHEYITNDNIPLYRKPSITVYHKMSASLWWFIVQKFHFARSFAGMRFPNTMWLRRAVYGAGSIILPVVLSRRIILGAWKKGVFRRELFLSLPFILLLFVSWSFGEFVGYLFGPGQSYSRVS
jgi:glycosyltransferase involved in cell wall biosynthesis